MNGPSTPTIFLNKYLDNLCQDCYTIVVPNDNLTEDIVHVLRIYEFVGPRSKIEKQIQGSVHGTREIGNGITIKAATIGEFPEIMTREQNAKKGYSAYVLTAGSREELLKRFPPKFPDIIAHHVTVDFGITIDKTPKPDPANIAVYGYVSVRGLEALLVSVNDEMWRNGQRYHITLSLDRSKGFKPKDSNKVIAETEVVLVSPQLSLETNPEIIPL